MDTHQYPIATSRIAARALNAARVLSLSEGCQPSTMLKREWLLGQLESPV